MKSLGKTILYVCLVLFAAFQIFPLLWLGLFSLKSTNQIFGGSPFSLPNPFHFENYLEVWQSGIGVYFLNSVWYTAAAIFFTSLFASMATFAMTRMKWKYSGFVLGLFMVGLMIPIHSALIPLFKMFSSVGLIDNPVSIIISYTAYNLPITVLILVGFFYTLPREIEEAAIMDGCSVHRLFFQIILPMVTPVMSTIVIINMIYNWNEFIFVNTFISSDKFRTLTVGIQQFVGQYQTDWGAIGATLVISFLPVLIAFLFFSNKVVEGIASSAVKG